MSLNILRAPVRRAVFSAPFPKTQLRTSFRHFSTPQGPPTPRKPNLALFAALGVAAFSGVGYLLYISNSDTGSWNAASALTSGQAVKAKASFTPTREDYQKVRFIKSIRSIINLPCALGVQ